MCCGMFNPFGFVIAGLRPKQVIAIKKGFGCPKVTQDTGAIVWDVSGASAITMDGRLLTCNDGEGVTPIDVLVDSAEPTFHARWILFTCTFQRRVLTPIYEAPDNMRTSISLAKYRFGKFLNHSFRAAISQEQLHTPL